MEELLNSTASRIALTASGIFFMAGLLTGVWKYICIRLHPRAEAPYYVNTAIRTLPIDNLEPSHADRTTQRNQR